MANQNFRVKNGLEVGVGGTILYAEDTGNVGIGSDNPGSKLDVITSAYPTAKFNSTYTSSSKQYTALLLGNGNVNQTSSIGYVYDTVTPSNSFLHITPYGNAEGSSFVLNASGNIGIGTDNPQEKLEIEEGNIRLSTDIGGTVPKYAINWTGGGAGQVAVFSANTSTGEVRMGADNDSGTYFTTLYSNGDERLRITSTGNVGIGTDNPSQKLDVNGAARFRGAIYDNNNAVGAANSVLSSTGSGVQWVSVAAGSDAGTLDGLDSSQFLRSDAADTASSVIDFLGGSSTVPAVRVKSGGNNWSEGLAIHPSSDNDYALTFFRTTSDLSTNTNTWALGNLGVNGTNNFGLLRRSLSSGSGIRADSVFDVTQAGVFRFGFNPTVGSNAIWHAGNDGSGSGLDADLLDGQHGSYYLNTSTSFGGDVSGTYNAIVVADDSHNHIISNVDGLQTALDGKLSTSGKAADSNLLDGIDSGSFLRSDASDTFTGNLTGSGNANILFGPNSTWSKYLKVGGNGYGGNANTASLATTNGNLHMDAATSSAMYLNYYAGTAGVVFGNGANGIVAWMGPDGDLWKGTSDNSGSKYWHAGNDGSGSGLDADLLDGQQGSYYQPASTALTTSTSFGGDVSGTYNAIVVANDSHSHSEITTKGNYIWSAGSAPRSFPLGVSISFVRSTEGWQSYGSVLNMRGYAPAEDGSTAQFYFPYSSIYGGNSMQYRLGLYSNTGWTGWKTPWDNTNDGSGSGLDADLLDGINSGSFLRSDTDDNTTGRLVIGGNFSNNAYNSVSSTRLLFGGGNDPDNYFIGTNLENYGGNFTKLDLRWHTGIRMGAQPGYGGVRIFNNEDLSTLLFSVGRGDGNTRVESGSLLIGGNTAWHAGNDGAGSGLDADNLDGYTWESSGKNVRATEFYADNWFRNYNSSEGLYNQATGQHWYSDDDDYWNIAGGSAANGIRFRDEHAGTVRGYVYANNSNDVGFLNSSGNWRVRVVGADYTLFDGSSIRAQLYYDSNDTGYYLNPNSTSNLWYVQLSDRLSLVKNRSHFTGLDATSSAGGRGQIVVNSYYSDVVIASQQNNGNHGSTLSFTAVNPSNSGDYRKFVINQGNWGGSHLLRFGWRDGSYINPHDYVGGGFGGSYDVLGLDGINKITYAFSQMRSPIYYDYNNTGYYVDPASTSVLNITYIGSGGVRFEYGNNNNNLYVKSGTNNSDVGISMFDNNGNHKVQLYGSSDGINYGFLNGNWASWDLRKTKNGNMYLNNQSTYYYGTSEAYLSRVYGITDSRSPLYYDSDNTGYYVNPASESNMYTATFQGNAVYIRGTSPTLYFRDTDNRSSMIHCNSNLLYVLRGSGNDSTSWATYGSYWPLAINLENNNAEFGGNILARGTVTATSDIRLKTNIEPITNALDKVLNLRGVKYNRIDLEGHPKQIGVIAQEVEEVIPELIGNATTTDPNTGEVLSEHKTVAYGNLTAVLIEAIKEQNEVINTMRKEIDELKKKLGE